jgi:aspartyl-tRNA(Asn)/glutamyl-tRNA(Gln) amidotransferase subunit B
VDRNRAVPLLEIAGADALREKRGLTAKQKHPALLRQQRGYGGVRWFEEYSAPTRQELGLRTECEELELVPGHGAGHLYEVERQSELRGGGVVEQETRGWSEARGQTYSQRSKEDAHDYRYFPEPDLPPLVVAREWIQEIEQGLPELPEAKYRRFIKEYSLTEYDAARLTEEPSVADYFENAAAQGMPDVKPKTLANWILGDLFSLMNEAAASRGVPPLLSEARVSPEALANLARIVSAGEISQASGKRCWRR